MHENIVAYKEKLPSTRSASLKTSRKAANQPIAQTSLLLQSGSERPQNIGETKESKHITPETLNQYSNELKKGRVKNSLGNRSYDIESNGQTYRRNRQGIRPSQHANIDSNFMRTLIQNLSRNQLLTLNQDKLQ